MVNHRKLAGTLLSVVSLHSAVVPVMLEAVENRRAAYARTTSIVFYSPDGRIKERYDGANPLIGVATSFAEARRVDPSILERARATIQKLSKLKGAGWNGMAMSLQIITALEAPTQEEFHAAMRELPITIVRSSMRDGFGRTGVMIEFLLNGERRASVTMVRSGESVEIAEAEAVEAGSEEAEAAEASGMPSFTSSREWCNYDEDPNSEWYGEEGECATEQELEDAMLTMVASEYEIEMLQQEADEAYEEWLEDCLDYYEYEDCTSEEPVLAHVSEASPVLVEATESLILGEASPDAVSAALTEAPTNPAAESILAPPCTYKKVVVGANVAFWGWAKIGVVMAAKAFVLAPVAATGPVGWILAGAVVASLAANWMVADAAVGLQDCLNQVM